MVATDTQLAQPEQAGRVRAGVRTDIEGLRALAIGLVLIYHAGITFLPGGFIGVDVFFVLSGFLITGILVKEVERTGRISLGGFYARRARRLLPAAALALVATAILTWLTASVVEWQTIGWDIASAAVYVVNWRLADRSVDYLAEGIGASPVQHFWSLAVEEQFYIVWPLLLLAVAAVVRVRRLPVRPLMALALTLIVAPSLIWSVVASGATPESAFFVTTTRLWELGIGGLVAVGAGFWRRLPGPICRPLGWLGLTTVVAGGLLLDSSISWPSAWALVPTLGTAAVIIAGSASSGSAVNLLSWRPFVWIGGMSYSLYLWHWPLLIAAQNMWGDLGQKRGLAIMVLSIIPAWLSLKLVEDPIRYSKRLKRSSTLTLSLGLNLSVLGVVAGLLLAVAVPSTTPGAAGPPENLGANALTLPDNSVRGVEVEDEGPMTPAPQDAPADVPFAYDDECQADVEATAPRFCEYGAEGGSGTVVLAGDSKALQWVEPLDALAKRDGWKLLVATKSACAFTGARVKTDGREYHECQEYSANLVEVLSELRPDVVIVSQGANKALTDDGKETSTAMVAGLVDTWSQLESVGVEVVALLDNPRPVGFKEYNHRVYECVAEHPTDLSRCAFSRDEGIASSGAPALKEAAETAGNVDVIDITDLLCNQEMCPPVIGEVLVYRQGSHVTNTYALSMQDAFDRLLVPVVEKAIEREE